MRRLFVAVCGLSLLSGSIAFSDDPRPIPAPAPFPAETPLRSGPARDKTDMSVEHLLKAAEHLSAAGLAEEAVKLRERARQQARHDTELSRKEAELECLQFEVDKLRELTGQTPGVVIEFVAVEVQRSKLGMKARDFDKLVGLDQISPVVSTGDDDESDFAPAPDSESSSRSAVLEASPARLPLFKELREKGAIRILAEPTLLAMSRRPVKFLSGGQLPVRVAGREGSASIEYKTFGTQVEVIASVLTNQQLRLQTTFELSELRRDETVVVEGAIVPVLETRRISTDVELRLGQTLTIGRLIANRSRETPSAGGSDPQRQKKQPRGTTDNSSSADPVEFLVFVTPRLAHRPATPQPATILPAAGTEDSGAVIPAEETHYGPAVPVLKRRTEPKPPVPDASR